MLADHKFDIVLVGTPDHWHALTMIAAVKAGADVYCQKPISVDVVEGQAMLAAARKYGRVVQVGTQRRSTPHLIECIDRVIKEGKLGKIGHVDICCYYHMRANGNPPVIKPPDHFDYEMWTGPAPLRPYDAPPDPNSPTLPACRTAAGGARSTNTATASSATCASTCSTWSAGCSTSAGRAASRRPAASTCRRTASRTSATRRPPRSSTPSSTSSGSTARGATRPIPITRGRRIIYGDKGTLKADVHKYEFFPAGKKAGVDQRQGSAGRGFP